MNSTNGMFQKQALNIPLQKGIFVNTQKAAALLMRAFSMLQSGFEWVVVDKPVDGTLFLFATQAGIIEIPEDGYGWMDDESYQRFVLENGVELEVFTRNHGFQGNESHCTVRRQRFRLVQNSGLQLMHYIRVPFDASCPPVQPHLIKVRPRMTQQPGALSQQRVQMNNQMATNQAAAAAFRQKQLQQQQQLQQQKLRQAVPLKIVEDEREPEGDELDKGFARIICLDRYKRNHLFIEQIFSPHSISSLVSPQLFEDTSEEKFNITKQYQADLDKELEELQAKFSKEIKEYKASSSAEWKLIHDLKKEGSNQTNNDEEM
ncbi:hypothetical protein BC833DRAFT_592739, partial [Globomyces pollinis-pini]